MNHEERCSQSGTRPNVTKCITRFIEEKAGCTLPVQDSNLNNVTRCTNITTIHKYLEMNRECYNDKIYVLNSDTFYFMIRLVCMSDEGEIYKLTGCMSSCIKDELDIVEASEMVSVKTWDTLGYEDLEYGRKALKLYLYFINGQYDEREQYVIYDYNSFIADVGGYMGLLLGISMQSMYEIVEGWFLRVRGQ